MALSTAEVTAVKQGITARFDAIVGQAATEVFYPALCTIVPSMGVDEQYAFLGSMPGVREWLGERDFQQLRAGDFTIKNKLWESSLVFERHLIDDDRLGMLSPLIEDLAREATQHPDELLFEVLLAGTTDLCWDGQPFFSNSHSWGDSGTQDNTISYTPAAGAAGAIVAGDIKGAVQEARTRMSRFKNDQGKLFNRTILRSMANVSVLIPPELEQEAINGLFTANYQLTSGVGGDNPLAGITNPGLLSSPQLTDARKMYVFNTGRSLKPFIFQIRERLRRQVKGATDIEHKNVLFMTEARYNVGYGAWMSAIEVTFP